MSRVDLNILAEFVVVARHLSFRRAAAELACAPSTLSDHIRKLEAQLDTRLFNRTTRSCALTEQGARLLDRVQGAITLLEDTEGALRSHSSHVCGTLRINGSRPAIELCLMPFVTSFLTLHPGVRMELITQSELVDVVAAGFDAGVRYDDTLDQDMVALRLAGPQRMVIAASPTYLARHGSPTHPNELGAHECIGHMFLRGNVLPWFLERDQERLDFVPRDRLLINQIELAKRAACRGLGLVYLFEEYLASELETGELIRVLDAWTPAFDGPSLYYPERRLLPPALYAFVEHIKIERILPS